MFIDKLIFVERLFSHLMAYLEGCVTGNWLFNFQTRLGLMTSRRSLTPLHTHIQVYQFNGKQAFVSNLHLHTLTLEETDIFDLPQIKKKCPVWNFS